MATFAAAAVRTSHKIRQRPAQGHGIERIEHLGRRKEDDLQRHPRRLCGSPRATGYDTKALRTIIRMRKQDANERAEQETILETYMQALGML